MLKRLRHRVLDRVFGQGLSGFVAASLLGWLIDQIRAVDDPERLDVARLAPGETYLVTTRPAMSRAERRDARRREKVAAALAKESAPSRRLRRSARSLDRKNRKLARASDGSRRQRRLVAETAALAERVAELSVPSVRQQRLEATVAELDGRLARQRDRAVAAARKKSGAAKRRPRVRTFR